MGLRDYSTRIWEGDVTAVAEARQAYRTTPSDEMLIKVAVALYSFRNHSQYASELIGHTVALLELAEKVRKKTPCDAEIRNTELCKDFSKRADVLSTVLEWISRQRSVSRFGAATDYHVRIAVRELCDRGIEIEELNEDRIDHTLALLHLTAARTYIEENRLTDALLHLSRSQRCVTSGHITDANQLVRVEAKLGMLYRRCGETKRGFRWGIRALRVSSVPMNVRLKALAALANTDK